MLKPTRCANYQLVFGTKHGAQETLQTERSSLVFYLRTCSPLSSLIMTRRQLKERRQERDSTELHGLHSALFSLPATRVSVFFWNVPRDDVNHDILPFKYLHVASATCKMTQMRRKKEEGDEG